mgnify:CR=1 FL=1
MERFGHWKDTAIMLKGDAVKSFTFMFLQMWNINEREKENYSQYLLPPALEQKGELGFVMPYAIFFTSGFLYIIPAHSKCKYKLLKSKCHLLWNRKVNWGL